MNAKIGRPKSTNPKSIRLEIRLNFEENKKLEECIKKLNLTKTDVLMQGLNEIYNKIKK